MLRKILEIQPVLDEENLEKNTVSSHAILLLEIQILKEILEMEPCLEQDILASDKFQLGQVSQCYFGVFIGHTIIKAKWCDAYFHLSHCAPFQSLIANEISSL